MSTSGLTSIGGHMSTGGLVSGFLDSSKGCKSDIKWPLTGEWISKSLLPVRQKFIEDIWSLLCWYLFAIVLIVSPGLSGQLIQFWNGGPVLSIGTTIEFTKLGARVIFTSWQLTRSEILEITTRCLGMTLPAALCMFMLLRSGSQIRRHCHLC